MEEISLTDYETIAEECVLTLQGCHKQYLTFLQLDDLLLPLCYICREGRKLRTMHAML